jgi:hypothetical protein
MSWRNHQGAARTGPTLPLAVVGCVLSAAFLLGMFVGVSKASPDAPRSTPVEAYRAATIVVAGIAKPFDSKFVIGSCRHPVGHRTRWCAARIEGKYFSMRLRVFVAKEPDLNFLIWMRAR